MLRAKSVRIPLTLAAALATSSLLLTDSAHAATTTTNVAVSATVTANCTISSTGVAFGSYDPVVANASTNLDATGTLSVTCTSGSNGDITLSQGANPTATSTDGAPARRMANGTNFLSYSLFQDSARTAVWGNTTTTDISHTGTGTATAVTVYGRVASGQNVPAGSYTDTVVATVTF